MSETERCAAFVYKRDTYRYTGRTASGFTMHYSRERCSRAALPGRQKCWQHDEAAIEQRTRKALAMPAGDPR